MQRFTRVALLVLEDFGVKTLGPAAAEDLLEVLVRRHETASVVITTNRPTQDWGVVLGDVLAATAIASSPTRRSCRWSGRAIDCVRA